MHTHELRSRARLDTAGDEMHALVRAWYPIARSITGEGIREQFRRIAELIPLEVHSVPTGTPLFDWTAPREWNIRDAYVKDCRGRRVVDWRENSLHALGYSVPVRATLPLDDLKKHCFTLPDQPDLVPFRNSFYKENWGFCLSQRALDALPDGDYDVCIDSTLEDGALNYAECYLPGETDAEIFFSAHACHPALANDNLSGLALATWIARAVSESRRHYSYRFVFAPGTIGAIAWLARNEDRAAHIRHGLILACLGDAGHPTYKQSRRGNAPVDKAMQYVLEQSGRPHEIQPFSPYGYDERQYCSPGFNLPIGCFMRTPPGTFPEYHTSADNPDFVRPESLADSLGHLLALIEILERDATFKNTTPKCEPMLGKRGLYGAIGGATDARTFEMALLWVLNLSDGEHTLLDIARRSGLAFADIRQAADALLAAQLLAPRAN